MLLSLCAHVIFSYRYSDFRGGTDFFYTIIHLCMKKRKMQLYYKLTETLLLEKILLLYVNWTRFSPPECAANKRSGLE